MKELINIVQLRSTIFLNQNIGYTPENAEKFRALLMPDSKIYGINQTNIPIFGVNPNMPQYGMPWRLFKRSTNEEYNIAFLPGKIDIVLEKEASYGDDTEINFCKKSIEWFSDIIETQDNFFATRIAYAPLYSISKNNEYYEKPIWSNLLKNTIFNGIQARDINLSFLLKKQINFNGRDIQMNFLHNIFDGNKIKNEGTLQIANEVLLLQLDLNSIPEDHLSLRRKGIEDFFSNILDIKCELIDDVTK